MHTAEKAKQYLVVYEDGYGEIESTIMVTAMPIEVGLRALRIGRVITCEELSEDD